MTSPHQIERQRGIKEAGQQLGALRDRWPLAFPVQHQDIRPLALGVAHQVAAKAYHEHAAARQADQEQQLAAARAAADRATGELVELARRLAQIAETQTAAETTEAEPEPPRRSKLGRAWGWFLRN